MSGQVARPKIFIDYPAYFRATGSPVSGIPFAVQQPPMYGDDINDVFTLDPSKTKEFRILEDIEPALMVFVCVMGDPTDTEIRKLTGSMNYVALLNHNFWDLDGDGGYLSALSYTNNPIDIQAFNQTSIVGGNDNGFSLFSLNTSGWSSNNNYGFSYIFTLNTVTVPLKLGAISVGRSFSFPHNANLSMNIDYSADGIKKSRSLGGHDIVDVNYYKQPEWDGRPPFVSTRTFRQLSSISHVGRRSWALTFSYLSADSTFPQDMGEGFMFDNVFADDGTTTSWTNYTTENLTSHFMTLTLNGQLPFIFQPDDTVNTFAMCRLRSNSFSVQQSAPNLYTCKMTFDETW